MIDPDYSFCLQPGEHFKPEVFATVAKAKAMLTVEEKHKIQGMIAERFLQRSRSDRLPAQSHDCSCDGRRQHQRTRSRRTCKGWFALSWELNVPTPRTDAMIDNMQEVCRDLAADFLKNHGRENALLICERNMRKTNLTKLQKNNWRRIGEFLRGE